MKNMKTRVLGEKLGFWVGREVSKFSNHKTSSFQRAPPVLNLTHFCERVQNSSFGSNLEFWHVAQRVDISTYENRQFWVKTSSFQFSKVFTKFSWFKWKLEFWFQNSSFDHTESFRFFNVLKTSSFDENRQFWCFGLKSDFHIKSPKLEFWSFTSKLILKHKSRHSSHTVPYSSR